MTRAISLGLMRVASPASPAVTSFGLVGIIALAASIAWQMALRAGELARS